jgi:hypothetical protein
LQKVLEATLRRNVDTLTVSRENNWRRPNNTEQIEQADRECQRLRKLDWVAAEPFAGPLERFQWRVSISCIAFCQFLDRTFLSILLTSWSISFILATDEIFYQIALRTDGSVATSFLAVGNYTKLGLAMK